MLEQIGAEIVMFLLGSALTYISTRWSKSLKKIDKLEYGVRALLRDRMLQMYTYYKRKHVPIPMREVESFELMYVAYGDLEGNGFMPDIRREFIEEMPHEVH